jgi:hypothetical protein
MDSSGGTRREVLQAGLGAAAGMMLVGEAMAGEKKMRVFEMRTYIAHPGKFEAMQARFRNHTVKLFEKHGMVNVGYWVPQEQKPGEEKLIYILAHKSRESAAASWKAFREDPEWQAARAASEKDGPIVKSLEAVYLNPTDYSTLK